MSLNSDVMETPRLPFEKTLGPHVIITQFKGAYGACGTSTISAAVVDFVILTKAVVGKYLAGDGDDWGGLARQPWLR